MKRIFFTSILLTLTSHTLAFELTTDLESASESIETTWTLGEKIVFAGSSTD